MAHHPDFPSEEEVAQVGVQEAFAPFQKMLQFALEPLLLAGAALPVPETPGGAPGARAPRLAGRRAVPSPACSSSLMYTHSCQRQTRASGEGRRRLFAWLSNILGLVQPPVVVRERGGGAEAALPVVTKVLRTLKHTEDATPAPATPQLHALCDIALALAAALAAKHAPGALPPGRVPGDVPLPTAFYRQRPKADLGAPPASAQRPGSASRWCDTGFLQPCPVRHLQPEGRPGRARSRRTRRACLRGLLCGAPRQHRAGPSIDPAARRAVRAAVRLRDGSHLPAGLRVELVELWPGHGSPPRPAAHGRPAGRSKPRSRRTRRPAAAAGCAGPGPLRRAGVALIPLPPSRAPACYSTPPALHAAARACAPPPGEQPTVAISLTAGRATAMQAARARRGERSRASSAVCNLFCNLIRASLGGAYSDEADSVHDELHPVSLWAMRQGGGERSGRGAGEQQQARRWQAAQLRGCRRARRRGQARQAVRLSRPAAQRPDLCVPACGCHWPGTRVVSRRDRVPPRRQALAVCPAGQGRLARSMWGALGSAGTRARPPHMHPLLQPGPPAAPRPTRAAQRRPTRRRGRCRRC